METDTDLILKTHDIAKTVHGPEGDLQILQPTSIEIRAGDSVAIIGPSGSGKTTLLGLLAGLDLPSQGYVEFRGTPLGDLDEDARAELRAATVGFVFQSFHLLASLTALENVMLPMELAEDEAAGQHALDLLNQVGLGDRIHHYPNQLSGGEKQRVAIARAFAGRPALLFADEPTGNLDTATGRAICNLIFELNSQHQTTLVLVTHDEQLAGRCNKQLRMEAGQVFESGGAA